VTARIYAALLLLLGNSVELGGAPTKVLIVGAGQLVGRKLY